MTPDDQSTIDHLLSEDAKPPSPLSPVEREALRRLVEENADLRDSIRLTIGMEANVPWPDVAQSHVDGYLKEIRRLKGSDAHV